MKWIWYEFKVDERTLSLHNSIYDTCQKPTLSPLSSSSPNLPLREIHVE
jgi:hypothetical protein